MENTELARVSDKIDARGEHRESLTVLALAAALDVDEHTINSNIRFLAPSLPQQFLLDEIETRERRGKDQALRKVPAYRLAWKG